MRQRRLLILAAACALFGFVIPAGDAKAQQKTLKEQLVGAWVLVANDNVAPDGSKRQLFGAHPKGVLILDASGRYAQMFVNPSRPKFKGATRLAGTAEENTAVVHATAGHFGTWSVDEAAGTLTLHMDANIFPNDDGTDSTRKIVISGDELTQLNPAPSSGGNAVVVFKRAK